MQTKKSGLTEEAKLIRREINNLYQKGTQDFNGKVIKLQQEVDSLYAEMEAEADNPNRIGRGPIYQEIRRGHEREKTAITNY